MTKQKVVIAIPTKGRPQTKSWHMYHAHRYEFVHFVEPQDLEKYKSENVPNIHCLPDDDSGISVTRNRVIDWAREQGVQNLWMIDDDVNGFAVVKNRRCEKRGAEILQEVQEKVSGLPFPVVGLQYRQHAWSATKPYRVNTEPAEVAVLLRISKITWRYSLNLAGKEDRDFCMKAIKYSPGVLRLNKYAFNCPDVGTNEGGLQEFYRQGHDAEMAKRLAATWHPYSKIRKRNGRIDCKLLMADFAHSLSRDVK